MRWIASLIVPAMLIVMNGCKDKQDLEIQKYSIPKEKDVYLENHVTTKGTKEAPENSGKSSKTDVPEISLKAARHRMLAAIVPQGRNMFFFKLTVPAKKAGELRKKFFAMIMSLKLGGEKPTWTVPDGWKQLPDNSPQNRGFIPRLATILVDPGDKKLELTVTRLPRSDILSNVNRWRGQLSLPPVTQDKLYTEPEATQEVQQVKIDGVTVVLVSLTGFLGDGGMRRPPFAR